VRESLKLEAQAIFGTEGNVTMEDRGELAGLSVDGLLRDSSGNSA